MPTVHLTDRALIAVGGPEAEAFLQNILTVDLDTLKAGEAKPGALLTPQGKILFDFLVSRDGDGGFLIDAPAASADEFVKRLMLYRLRAKVTIGKQDQAVVAVSWQSDSAASRDESDGVLADRRFSVPVLRHTIPPLPSADAAVADWTAFRIARGVPESGDDFALGDAFPHDALLDQMDGVGFRKGCYVGQEVVSRMQHRGTARRRFLIARANQPLPPPGTSLTVDRKTVGALGSVAGDAALALVRIDRVKDALDSGLTIVAGDVAVALSIPGWARFTWPEAASEENA